MQEAEALAGLGLRGDRYASGAGSYNRNEIGNRQVTIMSAESFDGTDFTFPDSRRNIFTRRIEAPRLVNLEFPIGDALFKGVKYCYPCRRPDEGRRGDQAKFADVFFERGGLICEVIRTGMIVLGDDIITPY
ncbi:MAG: hypothetical protein WCK91_03115 [bacterium]